MPKHIRICHIGTMILEFFLVTSTALALGFIWFGLIKQTWDLDADPARWLTAVVAIILIEVVIFWIGIILVYTTSLHPSSAGSKESRAADLQDKISAPSGTRRILSGF